MFQWIAVHLGRRRQDELRAFCFRQTESLVGSECTDLQGWNRQLEVVDRARRACPVQHEGNRALDVDVVGDVVFDERELSIDEVGNVGRVSRQEVVDPDDLIAPVEKGFREMRSDEACRTRDDDAL